MRATNNRADSLTTVDGTQQFLTELDAVRYAEGAGWEVLLGLRNRRVATRPDIPDVRYWLEQAKGGRMFWKRDWLGCDTARSRVV